jgi:uncharacterized protein
MTETDMPTARSAFETERASRYIAQMCKHFAHKIETGHDETSGRAALPTGPALMEARDGALHFTVEAEDAAALERAKTIIESHIVRFAFREKLERLDWSA